MGLGMNDVITANHMISLITSSTTDPRGSGLGQTQKCGRVKLINVCYTSHVLLIS